MSHSDALKVAIIGSGPAGFTAAIYTARANLSPVVYEGFTSGGSPGGQLMTTTEVENFPGFPEGIQGPELMDRLRAQAVRFGTTSIMEDIVAVDFGRYPFELTTMNDETVKAQTVIIATGATAKRLPLDSEKAFWGKGISACAVCDGALPIFRNKQLAVIGGGDSAVEEAVHLTQFATRVFMIHRRGELRASKIMQHRAKTHPKIEILWHKEVEEFVGDKTLGALRLKDTTTGEVSTLEVGGAFEAIGHIPNTGFLGGQVELNSVGYIVTRPNCTATSVAGVFAAGDVQDSVYRQAITAAGSGCMAAIEAERWLLERDEKGS